MGVDVIKVAKALVHMKDSKNYVKVDKGFFKQQPSLEGYFIDLSKVVGFKFFIILNMSKEYKPDNKVKHLESTFFGVIQMYELTDSIENFSGKLEKFSSYVINVLESTIKLHDKTSGEGSEGKTAGLPYGYVRDADGKIRVDQEKAQKVKKIFSLYTNLRSMRKVSEILLNSNITDKDRYRFEVRGISNLLHDERYAIIKPSVIPISTIKQAQEILKRNYNKQKHNQYGYKRNY